MDFEIAGTIQRMIGDSEPFILSKEKHPTIFDKELKGRYLKEFVECCMDSADLRRLGVPENSEMMREMGDFTESANKLAAKITKGLDSDGAAKYGITMQDLIDIMSSNTKEKLADISTASSIAGVIKIEKDFSHSGDANESVTIDSSEHAINPLFVETFAMIFTACLMSQERMESDYLTQADKAFPSPAGIVRAIEKMEGLDHKQTKQLKEMFPAAAMTGFIIKKLSLDAAKNRSSPIAPLLERELNGDRAPNTRGLRGYINELIAESYNLNPKTKEGQEKIRTIFADFEKSAYADFGIAPPSLPQH